MILSKVSSRRNLEIEDWLNKKIYHPLAFQLAKKLSVTRITPNMLSIFGGCLVLTSSYIYTLHIWPYTVIIALILHLGWHVVDGADGDLAYIKNMTSPLGEIIDGLSDYISHIILYCILAYVLSLTIGAKLAWTSAILAGFSRILQANYYEVCRRQYQWCAYGKTWLGHKPLLPESWFEHIIVKISNIYLAVASLNHKQSNFDDQLIQELQKTDLGREAVKKEMHIYLLPRINSMVFLGANYRTIMLGISMLLGSPLWYFLYESIVLNIVYGWVLIRYKGSTERFQRALQLHSSE